MIEKEYESLLVGEMFLSFIRYFNHHPHHNNETLPSHHCHQQHLCLDHCFYSFAYFIKKMGMVRVNSPVREESSSMSHAH